MRQLFREKRCQIPLSVRHEAAMQAATRLHALSRYQSATHIACYQAYKDEFQTQALIEMIWQDHKRCYLPILIEENRLAFVEYGKEDTLTENKYGIPEPHCKNSLIAPAELDLVIVPLLAFDTLGNRLGTGGGYYDRTFAGVNKPYLLGLAYSAQRAEHLPVDEWDIKLDGVLTELGEITC